MFNGTRFAVLGLILGTVISCTDNDHDGVRDKGIDQCPTVPAGLHPDPTRPGCPSRDSDGDHVPDYRDRCPTEKFEGDAADPNSPGCPRPVGQPAHGLACASTIGDDCDGDGVTNSLDQCPTVPVGTLPSRSRPGCPVEDRDGDGTEDIFDACPGDPPGANPDPNRPGQCPDGDDDRDGVRNSIDQCRDEKANLTTSGSGDGGAIETVGPHGLHNDPSRAGCLLHPPTTGDPDAATAMPIADASVPPADVNTPPTQSPAVTITISIYDVAVSIDTTMRRRSQQERGFTYNRNAVDALCLATRNAVRDALNHPAASECASGEIGCVRRANDNVQPTRCADGPGPGCIYDNGGTDLCAIGAERNFVWRCGNTTVPCTAQNVGDAFLARYRP